MEDSEIISLFWRRSEDAITETADKYGAYCHAISFNLLQNREDAEECVNDTYQKAWDSIPPERPKNFKGWLGTVVRNISVDHYRKSHAQKRCDAFSVLLSELEECIPSSESVERIADARELTEFLNRWLAGRSAEDRNLFLRRYWFGEAVGLIGESKGLSANTVRQKLYRLRRDLKKHLEREGFLP